MVYVFFLLGSAMVADLRNVMSSVPPIVRADEAGDAGSGATVLPQRRGCSRSTIDSAANTASNGATHAQVKAGDAYNSAADTTSRNIDADKVKAADTYNPAANTAAAQSSKPASSGAIARKPVTTFIRGQPVTMPRKSFFVVQQQPVQAHNRAHQSSVPTNGAVHGSTASGNELAPQAAAAGGQAGSATAVNRRESSGARPPHQGSSSTNSYTSSVP
ncbi:uncharacterized protein EV422DRAFT_572643 [Fimicolochytrium jonesii]|uniref:uncharacterized protein n=1 Tax=Fimicolochytrium jonesii TaxID=1396493 RepID=UPI0022FE7EAD|nr:uncharacterized protein EV422DRAFT_572643 [Fimicolochytrium jonesii]KAI8815572.1 hypothetical protein EV422DRAFT_572643 [Fimicolochytrium jonesii]